VIQFLRFEEGDAETIAPSLFGKKHFSRSDEVDQPVTASAPVVEAATPAANPLAAANAPVGSPISNPFMH